MSTFQTLHQLHAIIGDTLSHLEANFKKKSLDWPSLDSPFVPGPAETAASNPDSVEEINKIVAAAEQLTATVRGPAFSVFDASMGYHLPSCLRYTEQTHIVEILHEAGPQGMHVKDIAEISQQNELKLDQVLRLLATRHIFREVRPHVFTNNRISTSYDTGKTHAEIMADPAAKYDGTNGMAAFIDMAGDEMFKGSAYMTENHMDPETKHSLLPSHAEVLRAFNTKTLYFQWLEETNRVRRFGVAMIGTSHWEAPDAILQGFPWGALPENSLLVDVGGGIGSRSLKIARAHPHIRVLIQDRAKVVALGEKMWQTELPDALATGRAKFQEHDFFEPQPCKDASVFMLRLICHDWSDGFVVQILKRLRGAALPHTKLVIGDHIIPYACPDDTEASDLPGATKTLAPAPLLANLGRGSTTAYWIGMSMRILFNAHERTLSQFVAVLAEGGWKVTSVHRVRGSLFGYITAVVA